MCYSVPEAGFEPATEPLLTPLKVIADSNRGGGATSDVYRFITQACLLADLHGIEPQTKRLERFMLPLHQRSTVCRDEWNRTTF